MINIGREVLLKTVLGQGGRFAATAGSATRSCTQRVPQAAWQHGSPLSKQGQIIYKWLKKKEHFSE